MIDYRTNVNTFVGLVIIAVMATGCFYLVLTLQKYTALAYGEDSAPGLYQNATYNFALDFGPGWPRLTVLERKEAGLVPEGVVRRLFFALPTEDTYYINGFSHPLIISLYPLGAAERLGLPGRSNWLGDNGRYGFVYEVWDEAPTDLVTLTPTPSRVARSFYFTN